MSVTCKRCALAPVACTFSKNGLELIYCDDCLGEVIRACDRVHGSEPCPEDGDMEILDVAEEHLQELVDSGEWLP